jgi:hypothetical protein
LIDFPSGETDVSIGREGERIKGSYKRILSPHINLQYMAAVAVADCWVIPFFYIRKSCTTGSRKGEMRKICRALKTSLEALKDVI